MIVGSFSNEVTADSWMGRHQLPSKGGRESRATSKNTHWKEEGAAPDNAETAPRGREAEVRKLRQAEWALGWVRRPCPRLKLYLGGGWGSNDGLEGRGRLYAF